MATGPLKGLIIREIEVVKCGPLHFGHEWATPSKRPLPSDPPKMGQPKESLVFQNFGNRKKIWYLVANLLIVIKKQSASLLLSFRWMWRRRMMLSVEETELTNVKKKEKIQIITDIFNTGFFFFFYKCGSNWMVR